MKDMELHPDILTAELEQARRRIATLEHERDQARAHAAPQPVPDFAELCRSADYLRCLIRSIPDLVWLKDPEGVYLSCNPSFEKLYGAREAEIIGRTDYDFVSRELADFFRERDRIAMQAGKPSVNEEWLTFSTTGYRGLFETVKTPMRDAGGNLIGVLGIARDITERKRTEEALEKRMISLTRPLDDAETITFEDLFNLGDIQRLQNEFADATGVASIICHPSGQPITRPSDFRRLCREVLGNPLQGCAGCRTSLTDFDRLSAAGPVIRQCPGSGLWQAGAAISIGGRHLANWWIGQVRDTALSPARLQIYAAAHGIDANRAAEAFAEIPVMSHERFARVAQALSTLANQLSSIAYQNVQQARFIAERKLAEAQLIEMKERAEAASRVKSEFLANMSHEVRTPLNGALSMLHLLEKTPLSADQAQYLRAAIKSARRLTGLLSDILDLSRIEAGKIRIEEAEFAAGQLKGAILELFGQPARERGTRLSFSWHGEVPPVLIGDEARLRQILFNLVGNAIKFTENGEVRIEAGFLPCGPAKSRVRMVVAVQDTGIGITDEQIREIFEPFVQAEETYARRFQGAGLGLSIVRKLVQLMHGEVAIDNGATKGTTIYVSLPFGLPATERQAAGTSTEENGGRVPNLPELRILLVEDEEISSMACRLMLEQDGHAVVTARNGLEAVEHLSSEEFDLILMDIQMPQMDGVEATRKIRASTELGPKARIPIIAMTAYTMNGDRENFLAAGMNDYVAKPICREEVSAAMARVMAGRIEADGGFKLNPVF